MKRLFISLSLILVAFAGFAQDVTGDWYGSLTVPGATLPVVMHIKKTAAGYSATMDSPAQQAIGIPMDETTFSDNKLVIAFKAGSLKYSGTFLPDSNKINGNLQQGSGNFPLILSREKQVYTPEDKTRPQDPKDHPYLQEEVRFPNPKGGNTLSGTLTLPSDGKTKKIVILITGSGPQNRNEEIKQYNHRPFLVLSDWLTRNGIGVLRYDDRGVAKSTGNFNTATTADFADDAEAAVNFIKSRPDLKSLSIGLLGHSEGGMIAPVIASRNKSVKFIVLLAGPGIPITELMVRQNEDQLRLMAAPDSVIMRANETNTLIYKVVTNNPSLSAAVLKLKLDSTLHKKYATDPENAISKVSDDKQIANISEAVVQPWFRYFLGFRPADYLLKVQCPVLALNGMLDKQVSATPNLSAIKAALTKGGNKRFEIAPMPGLNHMFQTAVTGGVGEYAQITETINPVVLIKVTSWINGL